MKSVHAMKDSTKKKENALKYALQIVRIRAKASVNAIKVSSSKDSCASAHWIELMTDPADASAKRDSLSRDNHAFAFKIALITNKANAYAMKDFKEIKPFNVSWYVINLKH